MTHLESDGCRWRSIGTWNASTLRGRWQEAFALMDSEHLEVLTVQETRMSADQFPSAEQLCRKAGLHLIHGSYTRDSEGRATGGVAILSRWPLRKICEVQTELSGHAHRVLRCWLHRHRAPALQLVAMYLHASEHTCAYSSIPARICTYLSMSAYMCMYLRASEHTCTYWSIPARTCTYLHIYGVSARI